ncbi:MAG: endolytic transglycosylase MltG [Dialister invisus]
MKCLHPHCGRAEEKHLSIHALMTIASMVEREARLKEDQVPIASVILARLEKQMPLQIDATVQYALGRQKEELTIADTKIDSPYNTYERQGLPPGPISSPGMDAVRAVLDAAPGEYLTMWRKKTADMSSRRRLKNIRRKSIGSMGQTTDMAMIADLRKELEREAEEENIPILRRAERKLPGSRGGSHPKRILEVGTAIGYSALFLAEHFPLAEIDTIEIDALRNERAVSVMQAAGFEQRVRRHLGDAGEVLSALAGPYDFVYLDGPKGQYLRH